MKKAYNILSLLKLKKFDILCKNEDEFINIQEYLFKKNYYWESIGKELIENAWSFPIIIGNYKAEDKFGGKKLIMDDFDRFSKNSKNKYVTYASFIRKQKFKKLNLL